MTTSLRLLTLTVAAALIWALAPPTPARAATETPVLTTPAGEFQPVRGENHLAWEQNTRARPNSFDVLVRPDGGSPIRANRGGKNGALGDIDGERLVYQEFRKRKSDLFFFNLTTGQRSRLPKAVNKRHWEYWPSLSDPWLLFARWNMKRDWRRLFLYNLETGERRVLARTRAERAFIGPGQVNEDYVVWSTCPPKGRCQVYRYHIPTGSKVRMPNPGAHQRAPSVTPEGTVYLRRGSKRCGNSVSLVRIDATGSVVLVDFPEAIDSGDTYAYTDQNGVTHLYYERVGCGGRAASDIHTLTDPELATLSVAVSGTGTGTVTSSPPGIVCGADCLADFPGGTQVTLQADPDPDSYFAGWAGACSGTGDCTLSMDGAKSVTATFHLAGSIAVVKDAVPDDGVDFEFDPSPNLQSESFFLDDDVDPTLPNQQTFSGLTAGTYTIQEVNLPSGWQIAGLECVGDEDGDTTTGASLATINLDPGEDIECTFTNAREGSITIVKDALPDDPQDFQFDPSPNLQNTNFVLDDDPGDGTWPREEPFNELDVPDTYTVTEVNIPDDWQLTDITCTGGGSNTTTAGATATIGLDAGEAVVCTFTNTEEGSITIVKDAVNNDPQDFSYTTTGGLSPATFTLDDDGVGSNQQLFTGLLPGSYTVTEDPNPAGWQLTDLSCNDPDAGTTWDLGTRTATIDLDPGEDVVCTFENTEEGSITIVKDALPDDPQDFGFSTTGLSPATFSLDDDGVGSNQRVFTDLLPGTYTVAEDADPSGWQLTDIACLGGGGNTSDTGRIATIGLDPGETVTCTFENTEEGSITIVKDAVPDDPQDFSYTTTGGLSPAAFSLDDDADGTLSNTRTFTGLLPGTYTVAEDADPAGWQLTDIACLGGGGDTSDAGRIATIGLDPGEDVTCTFENTKDGEIIVAKETLPDGSSQSFEFDPSYGPNFFLSDGGTNESGNLNPGTYSVAEVNIPSGWELTGSSCSDGSSPSAIGLSPGETVTCTFENTEEGSITIVKDALPDDPQDFGFSTTGGLSPATFSLDDDADGTLSNTRTFTGLLPGTYGVTEGADPPGWALTDLDCTGGGGNTSDAGQTATIGLDPGEAVTCTFENTEEGSITVVKDAVDDDPQDFGFSTTGGLSPATFSLDDDGVGSNQRVFTDLLPGTYTVAEDADPSGWQLTEIACLGGGGDTSDAGRTATIGLDPGETVTCTFENTQEGSITVVKDALPNDPQDFSYTTTGGLSPATFTLDDDADPTLSNTRTFTGLLPGTYTVAEDPDPAGWQLTDITCTGGGTNTSDTSRTATIGLDPGEAVTCTFTNTEEGSITIVKDALPNDPQDFSYTTTGLSPATFTLDDDADGALSNTRTFTGLLPGTYTVAEDADPPGWQLTDLSCVDPDTGTTWDLGTRTATIDLDAGEDIVCTFENTEEGSITIVKDAGDAEPTDFDFSTTGGLSPPSFTLDDDDSLGPLASATPDTQLFPGVLPGEYTVTETIPVLWSLDSLVCTDPDGGSSGDTGTATATIDLDPGEAVICTFTNSLA